MQLTELQQRRRAEFRSFVATGITPHADRWDRDERLPPAVVGQVAAAGYLGATVPEKYGGAELDAVTFGLLNEALGAGCSSVRSVLTVHSMVAHAVLRWGSEAQKDRWLPLLATGQHVGGFALTEPGAGSDAASLETTATREGEHYVLDGTKRWITYGQAAEVFLVFARCDGKIAAFLVERDRDGFDTVPMTGLLGTRASMLAELRLRRCRVPLDALVGRIGFGLTAVATSALDVGRFSVAWGCVGLAQACLDASVSYANRRRQFDKPLAEHQLIQRLLTDMVTDVSAARLLCHDAATLKDACDPVGIPATWMAKYFAARAAFRAATDAVQVHGANGCGLDHPVQRYLRDAKVMEIIEGSTEVQQVIIARSGYPGAGA